jgi:hypothetical protein
MATSWQLSGTNQLICAVKQSGAAAEAIAFKANGGEPCSLLGGYATVIVNQAGQTSTVDIGATTVATIDCAAAGTFFLELDATAANLNIDADESITITTGHAALQIQVTLFISQASPATLA